MAKWQLLTWLATSERETQMVWNLMLPHEDDILNKFRIWKERHLQVKNSPYYNAPAGDRTHDLLLSIDSAWLELLHFYVYRAIFSKSNHSAMEAGLYIYICLICCSNIEIPTLIQRLNPNVDPMLPSFRSNHFHNFDPTSQGQRWSNVWCLLGN